MPFAAGLSGSVANERQSAMLGWGGEGGDLQALKPDLWTSWLRHPLSLASVRTQPTSSSVAQLLADPAPGRAAETGFDRPCCAGAPMAARLAPAGVHAWRSCRRAGRPRAGCSTKMTLMAGVSRRLKEPQAGHARVLQPSGQRRGASGRLDRVMRCFSQVGSDQRAGPLTSVVDLAADERVRLAIGEPPGLRPRM